MTRASKNTIESNQNITVEIKKEPEDDLNEIQLEFRSIANESDVSSQCYQYESIRDQIESIWNGEDVKPKIEHSQILESDRRLVVDLDRDWLRNNFRSKWISLVKSTFRHGGLKKACQVCTDVLLFKSSAKLIEHYKKFHGKQNTTYKCTLCEFSGKKEAEIVEHWRVKHKNEKKL